MTIFEQMGGTYSKVGDYYLPNLTLPEEQHYDIGRFGLMRRHYLKNHRKGLFSVLLTSGKLNEHLYEIDQTANARMELLSKQMAKSEGVTEQLKAENQSMNSAGGLPPMLKRQRYYESPPTKAAY